MAQIFDREQERQTFSNHSSPTRETESPLVLDNSQIDDDMDDDGDLAENLAQYHRAQAAGTLYHQPRSESDTLNSTQSLFERDIEYQTIHERRYCDNYWLPNDDAEQERMQMLHEIFLTVLGGRLTLAPLQSPQKILDIGTGTGEWAMSMAELYPSAEIVATDIADIQPTSVLDNVYFQIDDAEYEGGWTWPPDSFDFVHFRNMLGAFKDWNHLYREAYKNLKPGGYIEVVDLDVATFMHGFFDNPLVLKWFSSLVEATKLAGRPLTADHLDPQPLAAAGFTDISVVTKSIPCGFRACESDGKRTGMYFLAVLYDGIEAGSLKHFVEQLHWDPEDVTKLCKEVAKAIRALAQDQKKSQGFSMDLKVLVGRKPGGNEFEVLDDKSSMGDSMRTITNGDLPRAS